MAGSTLHSGGKIDIDAANTASIDAAVVSASVAVAFGVYAGIGASIGVALARNYIGFDPDYNAAGTFSTGDNPASIANLQTVRIKTGVGAGNVYQYIGGTTLNRPTTGAVAERNNWLTRLDFSDTSKWRLANLDPNAAEVVATITTSNVDATGALTLDAVSDQDIHAIVFAGSVALSGGFVGASLSGAGAASDNRISTFVHAGIDGDKDNKGISAGSVHIVADDTSKINSFTGAVAVAAGFGAVGAAVSVGVGIAFNEVDNDVAAYVKNVANDVTAGAVTTTTGVHTTSGAIDIEAHEDAGIHALAGAASVAIGGGLVGGAISGAGAFASNVILGSTRAQVADSALDSFGDVKLVADNTSIVDAKIAALTRALDYFDLETEYGGKLANAFVGTKTRFCVVSFTSDWLYPTHESKEIIRALNAVAANVSFVEVETDKGHDAFLLEEPVLFETVRGFLNANAERRGIG